jgi:hypothetical protein
MYCGIAAIDQLILHVKTSSEIGSIVSGYEQAFKKAVDDKFKEYLAIRGTAKNTGECMTELFDQIRQHRVNMDGDVCTVMVTTLILEVLPYTFNRFPSTFSKSMALLVTLLFLLNLILVNLELQLYLLEVIYLLWGGRASSFKCYACFFSV